jgi:hypothetical protein
LRRVNGYKRDEITNVWRNLNNDKLHNFYFSPNIIRTIKSMRRWTGYVARMRRGTHIRVLVGKPEGRRPLGIP